MATDKIQTGIRFHEEMLKKITYIAKKNHRSLNAQLEHLTQECIDAYEQQHGKINTAIGCTLKLPFRGRKRPSWWAPMVKPSQVKQVRCTRIS